jgi:hypothetical protein
VIKIPKIKFLEKNTNWPLLWHEKRMLKNMISRIPISQKFNLFYLLHELLWCTLEEDPKTSCHLYTVKKIMRQFGTKSSI